jgi:hypothetical protein
LPIEQRRRAFVRELAQVARTEVLFPQQLAMSVQCENTHDPIRIADRMFDRTAVHGHEAGKKRPIARIAHIFEHRNRELVAMEEPDLQGRRHVPLSKFATSLAG